MAIATMTGDRFLEKEIVTIAGCKTRPGNSKIAVSKSNIHPNPQMKNYLVKLLPLMAIVIAIPAVANSQSFRSNASTKIAAGEMGRYRNGLNLSADQKTKMEQLRTSKRTQIDAVLTPTQRQQLAQLKAARQANRGSKGKNLTTDQKAKLKAIRESNQAQFKAILTPAQQAQLAQGGGWGKGSMARLNLTPAQTAKMQQLRASARSQMDAILTPEQQQQAQARRQSMRNTWNSLNLTPDQQAKIQAIRQSSRQQLNTILTPEQQTKLKSRRQGRGADRV
jgi:Spy/CpxP family protein refolding chaperone